ncbi:NAD(P)-binding domain-containing protein [Scytonema millei]|uniref:NAD(P)-binding domain-containing protein n=1 Tax=Scytonema millei TaxID=1245922 RepID=UPI0025730558|nr:NAD(P)-binding domain-containing protein [Scytonema millei]
MRFITPSFPSHGFGLLDLNAVVWDTSSAIAFGLDRHRCGCGKLYVERALRQ